MARLIDGDGINLALVERGQSDKRFKLGETIRYTPSEVQQIINEDMLTVDAVAVRHGHWVLFDNAMSMWNVWVCSECGYRRKEGWMHTEAGEKPEAQYCENCMAKMDGGVNDAAD